MRRACWWDQTPPICAVMLDDASSGAAGLNKRQRKITWRILQALKERGMKILNTAEWCGELRGSAGSLIFPCLMMNVSLTKYLGLLAKRKATLSCVNFNAACRI